MAADQERIAVGHPEHAQKVAVHGSRGVRAVAARRLGHKNLILVVWIAVARIPVSHAGTIRRKLTEAFELFVFSQLAGIAGFNVEDLQCRHVGVALLRVLLPGEEQPLAVGRPRDGRCRRAGRRALGKAPSAGGQPLCFSALCRKNPKVRRLFRLGRKEIVVTHLEGIVMFFDLLFVLRLVGSDVGDLFPVGPPGKLLNAVRRVGNLPGLAAGHGENENLWLCVFAGSVRRDKRQAVAAR